MAWERQRARGRCSKVTPWMLKQVQHDDRRLASSALQSRPAPLSFVLSLSKHRPSLPPVHRKTALRQAQCERVRVWTVGRRSAVLPSAKRKPNSSPHLREILCSRRDAETQRGEQKAARPLSLVLRVSASPREQNSCFSDRRGRTNGRGIPCHAELVSASMTCPRHARLARVVALGPWILKRVQDDENLTFSLSPPAGSPPQPDPPPRTPPPRAG
jgi:hypothetical protein